MLDRDHSVRSTYMRSAFDRHNSGGRSLRHVSTRHGAVTKPADVYADHLRHARAVASCRLQAYDLFYHSSVAVMPMVKVRSEGHRRSRPDASAPRRFPCPYDHAGGARPVALDRALPMVGVRVASTYGDDPSRRQPPSRLRPGFTLAASHSRSIDARRCRYTDQRARTHTSR